MTKIQVKLRKPTTEEVPKMFYGVPRRKTLVEMFMSGKFRWTANGRCPIWLVPEHREAI